MPTLLLYLLKVMICSGLLILYYVVALRNKKLHRYNRFYLLFTLLASIIVPLLHLDWFTISESHTANVQLIKFINTSSSVVYAIPSATTHQLSWQSALETLFCLICLFRLVTSITGIIKLALLKRKYPGKKAGGRITLIETDLPQSPFSFGNWLFWRKDIDTGTNPGKQIFRHELTHILEAHTADKLLVQLVLCLFWLNPFFWILQKELFMVHEFIADDSAIEGKNAHELAAMLLHVQPGRFDYAPAQPFFYSPIKRRLVMLTTSRQPRYSYLRRLMILPVTVSALFIFSVKVKATFTPPKAKPKAAATTYYVDTTKTYGKYKGKTVTDVYINADRSKVILHLDNQTKETVSLQEAEDNHISIAPEYTPANVVVTLDADTIQSGSIKMMSASGHSRIRFGDSRHQPLILIDNVIVTDEEMGKVDPNNIQSINILKDAAAVNLYGEKGKNGVVQVFTKGKTPELTNLRPKITEDTLKVKN